MSQHDGMERRFLRRLGEVLWIVPIGSIINRIGEGLFYPYVVFYLLGFAGIRKRVKTCTTIRYFLWLSWFSLLVVYLHIINTWFVSTRFLASFFLPSFIVIGFGLENITTFFQVKRKMARKAIITFLAVYILVWGIGRNVRYHYTERLPYKQAGTIIEQKRAPDAIEKIVARRSKAAEYTHFYAHRHCARPVCTASNLKNIPPSYSELIDLMTHRNIRYLIYESNTWPHSHFDFLSSTYHDDFNVLGQWESNDKEKLLLLELKAADLLRTG